MLKTKSVGAHSICARGGLPCRKRARADMESAPTFFCGGRRPLAEAVPRVELSPFVESVIRRGAFYMRPPKFILPQAGTGGYGIRPYVFCGGRRPPPQRAVPRVEFSPFVESEIRRGAFYMRPRKFALPQAGTGGYGIRPYVFCGGRRPLAEAVPRAALSPFVESEIRRGGQGARFCLLCVQADLFPLSPCQKPSYVVYYFSTSPQANPVQTGDAKL